MSKRGRGGAVGAKFRMSLALPVGAVMNCADNTGTSLTIVLVMLSLLTVSDQIIFFRVSCGFYRNII